MLPVQTILHPTDFSQQSQYAFQLACALARDHNARLLLLHVVTRPVLVYGEGFIPEDPEERFQEARVRLGKLDPGSGLFAERRVAEGNPVEEILHVAEEPHSGLIVMGTHGRTGLARLLMGSVAEQVVRKAVCPVLTVKSPFPVAAPAKSQPAEAAMSS